MEHLYHGGGRRQERQEIQSQRCQDDGPDQNDAEEEDTAAENRVSVASVRENSLLARSTRPMQQNEWRRGTEKTEKGRGTRIEERLIERKERENREDRSV